MPGVYLDKRFLKTKTWNWYTPPKKSFTDSLIAKDANEINNAIQ